MTALSIGEIIAILASLVAVGLSVIKTKPEIHGLNGEAAQSYSEAAKNYAAQVVDLQTRLTNAEQVIAGHGGELAALRRENADLRDWAERLVHQVRRLER